jgi:hypothetical protein
MFGVGFGALVVTRSSSTTPGIQGPKLWERIGGAALLAASCITLTAWYLDWGRSVDVTMASTEGVEVDPVGDTEPMCMTLTGEAPHGEHTEVWVANQDTEPGDPDWYHVKAEWEDNDSDRWRVDLTIGKPEDAGRTIDFIAYTVNGDDSAFLEDFDLVGGVPIHSAALPSGLSAESAQVSTIRSDVAC